MWRQLTLSNRVCELPDIVGPREATDIADAIDRAVAQDDDLAVASAFDLWLAGRLLSRPAADARIAAIHRALFAVPGDVPSFARGAGVAERTLHRLCRKAFGFSPKSLLRQKRFQRTLERVRGVLDKSRTGLIDDGYCDQAHFNREFRQYMGMSPAEYFNSPREIMRRPAEVRREIHGRGLQGLHPPR